MREDPAPTTDVTLRDGSTVHLREVLPTDRRAIQEGFEALSPESRYRRFFTNVSSLSERDLEYFTDIDHHRHEALVALEPGTSEGLGVARFIRTDELTPREQEVVKLVAEAHTNKEIAEILHLSEKTVENHRSNAMRKLGMRDRVELVRYAIRRGLIDP